MSFKELIEKERVFTFKMHFAPEDIKICICKYSFINSYDFRFCLHFDLPLFTAWSFYKLSVLLINFYQVLILPISFCLQFFLT